jgi:hypothetical protein
VLQAYSRRELNEKVVRACGDGFEYLGAKSTTFNGINDNDLIVGAYYIETTGAEGVALELIRMRKARKAESPKPARASCTFTSV